MKYENRDRNQSNTTKEYSSSSSSSFSSSSSSSSTTTSSIFPDTNLPLYNTPEQHDIFLGTLSKAEPGPLRITLSNFNPIKMPIYLESSDTPLCVCSDISWPIGRKDDFIAKGNIDDMTSLRTLFSHQDVLERCSCHRGDSVERKDSDTLSKVEELCHYYPSEYTAPDEANDIEVQKNYFNEHDIDDEIDDNGDDSDSDSDDDDEDSDDIDDDDNVDDNIDDFVDDDGDIDNDDDDYDDENDDYVGYDKSGNFLKKHGIGEQKSFKSLEIFRHGDMSVRELLKLEKEKRRSNDIAPCGNGIDNECKLTEMREEDLKKLKIKLKKLILMRKKLISRKKRVEAERKKAEEMQMKSLSGIEERDEEEEEKEEDVTYDKLLSNLKINTKNMKKSPLREKNSNKHVDKEEHHTSTLKNSRKKQLRNLDDHLTENLTRISSRTSRLGRPLRSLGLVYECGQRAIGAARAGYNSLFHITLDLNDVPSSSSSSASSSSLPSTSISPPTSTSVHLSTPFQSIILNLYYIPTKDKLSSYTIYNDKKWETTMNKKNRKFYQDYKDENKNVSPNFPQFFFGGIGSISIKVVTTLTQGTLLDSWVDILRMNRGSERGSDDDVDSDGNKMRSNNILSNDSDDNDDDDDDVREVIKIAVDSDRYVLQSMPLFSYLSYNKRSNAIKSKKNSKRKNRRNNREDDNNSNHNNHNNNDDIANNNNNSYNDDTLNNNYNNNNDANNECNEDVSWITTITPTSLCHMFAPRSDKYSSTPHHPSSSFLLSSIFNYNNHNNHNIKMDNSCNQNNHHNNYNNNKNNNNNNNDNNGNDDGNCYDKSKDNNEKEGNKMYTNTYNNIDSNRELFSDMRSHGNGNSNSNKNKNGVFSSLYACKMNIIQNMDHTASFGRTDRRQAVQILKDIQASLSTHDHLKAHSSILNFKEKWTNVRRQDSFLFTLRINFMLFVTFFFPFLLCFFYLSSIAPFFCYFLFKVIFLQINDFFWQFIFLRFFHYSTSLITNIN